ncbi:MAG: phosphoribosylformylglycinamidine cyclo-ligase, partial [Deltaproteobacteria bacterium]|nr:phosphoribosylformylglycinamidine cyclo-ligase [Deltaproteobacteria bacterium]
MSDAYRKSGVNIDEGNLFVDRIRPFVERTHHAGVLGGIGSFAGFFRPDLVNLK